MQKHISVYIRDAHTREETCVYVVREADSMVKTMHVCVCNKVCTYETCMNIQQVVVMLHSAAKMCEATEEKTLIHVHKCAQRAHSERKVICECLQIACSITIVRLVLMVAQEEFFDA